MAQETHIPNQVKLPLKVAMEVALQGIRIRLGRSLITLTGVVLGIAFLMSILSAQVIRKGVASEAELRTEVKRMVAFLTAETGPLKDRTVGVLQVGNLDEKEQRLAKALEREGVKALKWAGTGGGTGLSTPLRSVQQASEGEVGREASAVLVVGEGKPAALDYTALLAHAEQRVVAFTRTAAEAAAPAGVTVVSLAREMREDEVQKMQAEQVRARFRSIWMTVIALVVTLISVSNSLLMSATERFREIGTMKCLGALSSFIRQLFLIESSLIGLVGGIVGAALGPIFAVVAYGVTFGFPLVMSSMDVRAVVLVAIPSIIAGIILSITAALYPAHFAARMVPGTALRTNI